MEKTPLTPSEPRNIAHLIAGILYLITACIHLIAGGIDVHQPVLISALDPSLKAIFSVIWHMISLTLILNGLALIWIGLYSRNKPLTLLILAQSVGGTVLFMFYGWIRLGTLFILGQWTFFLLIAMVQVIGLWIDRRRNLSIIAQSHG